LAYSGAAHIAAIPLKENRKVGKLSACPHWGKSPHIAMTPRNSLKNNDRPKAHIAPFYLALLIGVFFLFSAIFVSVAP
jgi:hypothetical protein